MLLPAAASQAADGGWQVWNRGSISGRIAEGWAVRIGEEFRFADGEKELYYHLTSIDITYQITPWLSVGPGYAQLYSYSGAAWMGENRPMVNGNLSWAGGLLGVSDRSRFEYRIREGAQDIWRYRNLLKLSSTRTWTRLALQPYISNEFFVVLNGSEWNANRLYAGIRLRPFTFLTADIFYLRQSKKTSAWTGYNVIGSALSFSF